MGGRRAFHIWLFMSISVVSDFLLLDQAPSSCILLFFFLSCYSNLVCVTAECVTLHVTLTEHTFLLPTALLSFSGQLDAYCASDLEKCQGKLANGKGRLSRERTRRWGGKQKPASSCLEGIRRLQPRHSMNYPKSDLNHCWWILLTL